MRTAIPSAGAILADGAIDAAAPDTKAAATIVAAQVAASGLTSHSDARAATWGPGPSQGQPFRGAGYGKGLVPNQIETAT